MRIIQSENPRPLNLLAVGANGLVAAATITFGVPGDVEVWDVATAARCFVHPVPINEAEGIAFTPEGRLLFIGARSGLAIFGWPDWTRRHGPPVIHPPIEFALSGGGTRLLVVGRGGHTSAIECFAIDAAVRFSRIWVGPNDSLLLRRPVLNRDGTRAAVVADAAHGGPGGRASAFVQVHDAAGKIACRIPLDPADPPVQLAFTADGSELLALSSGRTVPLFDAATGAPAGKLVHRGRPFVTGVAVHPRGAVACARTDGTVTFWDAVKCEPIRTLDWKAGRLVSVAFSPDGALAAAGTEDGKVVVWDVDV